VGRVYLQAVVDTYSCFAFAKLYNAKLAITAADLVYDRVLPFYEAEGLKVEAILTDNGRANTRASSRSTPTSSCWP